MIDEELPIIAIKRSLGYPGFLRPLRVFVDEQPVGMVRFNRTKEFPVLPGKHLVTVIFTPYAASLPVRLRDGDRVELICTRAALPLHSWQVHSFCGILFFCFVMYPLGKILPPIRAFMDKMVIEVLVALGMGLVGMMIYVWRVHNRAGGWQRQWSICLTFLAEEPSEEQFEEEQS